MASESRDGDGNMDELVDIMRDSESVQTSLAHKLVRSSTAVRDLEAVVNLRYSMSEVRRG